MKIFFAIVCFFLFSCSFANDKIPIELLKVQDGDTVRVKIDTGNKFNIRLQGIDCFEVVKIHRAYRQAYLENLTIDEVIKKGNIAKKYLEKLSKNAKSFSFEFRGVDKYGRVLGNLFFDDININQKMLNNGYCMEYVIKEK